jgi:hypothetical protein
MGKQLQLILKEQPVGRESTPWLDDQRERFAEAARSCSKKFKDSKLKGAAKVRAMNEFMREELQTRGPASP